MSSYKTFSLFLSNIPLQSEDSLVDISESEKLYDIGGMNKEIFDRIC